MEYLIINTFNKNEINFRVRFNSHCRDRNQYKMLFFLQLPRHLRILFFIAYFDKYGNISNKFFFIIKEQF